MEKKNAFEDSLFSIFSQNEKSKPFCFNFSAGNQMCEKHQMFLVKFAFVDRG